MDLGQEIDEIGRLMMSASLLVEIRREVASVMRNGFRSVYRETITGKREGG